MPFAFWYVYGICPACGRPERTKAVGGRDNPAIIEKICLGCNKDVGECLCIDPVLRSTPETRTRAVSGSGS